MQAALLADRTPGGRRIAATFYRKGFVRGIEDAKRPETRARRITEMVEALPPGVSSAESRSSPCASDWSAGDDGRRWSGRSIEPTSSCSQSTCPPLRHAPRSIRAHEAHVLRLPGRGALGYTACRPFWDSLPAPPSRHRLGRLASALKHRQGGSATPVEPVTSPVEAVDTAAAYRAALVAAWTAHHAELFAFLARTTRSPRSPRTSSRRRSCA